jgi:hypothetical protein
MVITGSLKLIRLKLHVLYPNKNNKKYLRLIKQLDKMENKELTYGQKIIGLNFNHAEGVISERVDKAKRLSADLIDLVEEHFTEKIATSVRADGEGKRVSWATSVFRTSAFNAIIKAQMLAVKFITWKD